VTLFDAGTPASPQRDAASRLKLLIAYDGTQFRGFAAQRDLRTVEGVLTDALEKVLRRPAASLELACAGRTDKGVHAHGQVVSITAPPDTDCDEVHHAVNRMLGPEVVVRRVEAVAADFDARRSARWRRYRYTIMNGSQPDPFLAQFAWWVPDALDLRLLRLAADPFVGEHDFAAFCRRGPEGSTTTRRVLDACWRPADGDVLRFDIRAPAFCWQMVRSIVGTLVEAGSGKRRPGDILGVLRSRDRARAGQLAPPHGLCLWDVGYDDGSAPVDADYVSSK
jgi:tRNA pseudouridine38-40 synthase